MFDQIDIEETSKIHKSRVHKLKCKEYDKVYVRETERRIEVRIIENKMQGKKEKKRPIHYT